MGEPIERKCKACGAKLVFAEGPNGNPIPLQKVRTVYAVADGKATVSASGELYISHFTTCSDPKRFSRAG